MGWIRTAHEQDRTVAVHCVTRPALALTLAALDAAGAFIGDRIEHGSVVPPQLRTLVASLGLVVVTQPNFVAERGDRYLAEVDADDQPHLYPCRSLLDAGVGVGGSTDALFGDPDPGSPSAPPSSATAAAPRWVYASPCPRRGRWRCS